MVQPISRRDTTDNRGMKREGIHRGRFPRKSRVGRRATQCGEIIAEQSKADPPVNEADSDRLLEAALRFWEKSRLSGE